MIAEWYGNDVLDGYYGGGGGGETIGMALMPFATLVSLYFISNAIASKLSAIKVQRQASEKKTASPTASKVATPAEVAPQRSEDPATSTIKATQSNSMEGANTVKCPVCRNETGNSCNKCSICGFSDLQRTFISTEDASDWFDRVVLPYRQRWASEQQHKKEASMSASTLYNQMQSAQFSQVSNFVKNEVSLFNYAPFQDGIELTSYNGEVSHVDVPEQINGLKVRRLGENLFAECQNLNSVHLPTTLREIGTKAFYHSTVSSVNIPSEVTKIGESAFSRSKLTEITFPQGIKCVEKSVCSACQKLQTVVILGAKTISDSAFGGCYALQHLILPDGLESIGQSAFSNTFPLTRIVVPATVKKIASTMVTELFEHCDYPVKWIDVITNAQPPDNTYNPETWEYLRSKAIAVFEGNVEAMLEIIERINPYDDLLDYLIDFEFEADDAECIEVTCRVIQNSLGSEKEDAAASLLIRLARDTFALLPVPSVRIRMLNVFL